MTVVTVLGEALIDIVVTPTGERTEHVGGSPANVAVGLARLGHGTALVTHIGTDERGQRIADQLMGEGVRLDSASMAAQHTSIATAQLDSAGVASYEFSVEWQVDPATALTPGSHVHTGSIAATLSPGAEVVRRIVQAARASSTVSYDPNVRPSLMGDHRAALRIVEEMVGLADVVKASDEDLGWLYPGVAVAEVLARWSRGGPRLCVATRGGGPVSVLFGGELHEVPARQVTVVDTVGAGDSFMAGLISGLLDAGMLGGAAARARLERAEWADIVSAVDRAIACAAITVGRVGANPPQRQQLTQSAALR